MKREIPIYGFGVTYEHANRLIESYKRLTGNTLIPVDQEKDAVKALFYAPFILLSHGTQENPVLNYGNEAALTLWEMDWDTFTHTPSSQTAEPMLQSTREEFLKQVRTHGFAKGYSGVRISKTGRRFMIIDVVLWNLIDESGEYHGQAAMFERFEYLH